MGDAPIFPEGSRNACLAVHLQGHCPAMFAWRGSFLELCPKVGGGAIRRL